MHPCKTITAVLPNIAILTFEVSSFLPKTPNNSKILLARITFLTYACHLIFHSTRLTAMTIAVPT